MEVSPVITSGELGQIIAVSAAIIVSLILGVRSLRQTGRIQANERKERLLNEIIEWARDVLDCGTSDRTKDMLKDMFGFVKTEGHRRLYHLAAMKDLQSSFRGVLRRSLYISEVAQGLKDDGLYKAVEQSRQFLQTHLDALEKWEKTVPKEEDDFDEAEYDEAHKKTLKSLDTLRASAQIVIMEATEIKVKLAG